MNVFVRHFVTTLLPSGQTMVFRAGGSCLVEAPPMQALLPILQARCGDILGVEEVADMLANGGVERQPGMAFLQKDLGLLIPSPTNQEVTAGILVITDLPIVGDMLRQELSLPSACAVEMTSPDTLDRVSPLAPLHVVAILGNYCSNTIRNIYRTFFAYSGVAFTTAYLYGSHFMIDGLYVPSLGLPCHFCHRHRLAALSRRVLDMPPASWSAARRHLDQGRQPGAVETYQLTRSRQGHMAFTLKHEIEALLNPEAPSIHADSVGNCLRIDMNTGHRTRDKVFHWDACDCLGGNWT